MADEATGTVQNVETRAGGGKLNRFVDRLGPPDHQPGPAEKYEVNVHRDLIS